MITINNETRNGLPEGDPEVYQMFDTTTQAKKSSTWSKPSKLAALLKYKIVRFLFCVNETMFKEIELECEVRDAIRDEMTRHTEGSGRGAVSTAMLELYESTGYDMCNFDNERVLANERVGEAHSESVHEGAVETQALVFGNFTAVEVEPDNVTKMVMTVVQAESQPRDAMVVPRFAASVVLALRSKFGKMGLTEANRLLIEREYLKVCRDVHVRNVDVVTHQQFVMNAYFSEGINDQLATTRVRLPRWLRDAFGTVPNASPTIC